MNTVHTPHTSFTSNSSDLKGDTGVTCHLNASAKSHSTIQNNYSFANLKLPSVTKVISLSDQVAFRGFTPHDAAAARDLFESLTPTTIRLRFFSRHIPPNYPKILLCDDRNSTSPFALGAFEKDSGRLLGIGECIPSQNNAIPPNVAFLVRDDVQKRGLGSALFNEVVAEAKRRGIPELGIDFDLEHAVVSKYVTRSVHSGDIKVVSQKKSLGLAQVVFKLTSP